MKVLSSSMFWPWCWSSVSWLKDVSGRAAARTAKPARTRICGEKREGIQ
ncbi:hypothetical protein E2C01_101469 [Portunus trituberculatus]|uniref:Uncharacterized protein n=1 Tax=Portunus trituberculatus TaxID=210409 RepID=A0A5B7KKI1_PORTR|nr:hypothetical protein [Portunus trituberculatus]